MREKRAEEIEWTYSPPDFLEAPYRTGSAEYDLLFRAGTVVATLCAPGGRTGDLEQRILRHVKDVLLVQQLRTHRPYRLSDSSRVRRTEGGRAVVEVAVKDVFVAGLSFDAVVTDAAGNVKSDTRAERIAAEKAFVDSLVPKLARSPILRRLLESWSRSVEDPGNEFVHLYEVRDGLVAHYTGEQKTCDALGITKSEWREFGKLTNAEPLDQGRHRGRHLSGHRAATPEELQAARRIAKRWIETFANTLYVPPHANWTAR